MKINHPSISTAQGNQLVPPLPSAPQPLTSQRGINICDILEKYAQYHPVINYILQILPKTRDTAKNMVMYYQSWS